MLLAAPALRMLGVVFAVLATGCGLAVTRALRLPPTVAPVTGLAAIAVLSVWCTSAGVSPAVTSGAVCVLALAGLAVVLRDAPRWWAGASAHRWALLVLAAAVATPTLILGAAFAGVEAPLSTHDGAFHVEAVDGLRRGLAIATWYPAGFHTSAAAVLGLAPWVDTARGTVEVGQGLAMLAPLSVFSLALALEMEVMAAVVAAAVLSLTWTYPYDYHLWAGWPQGMGVLLLLGLLTAALHWTRQPAGRWAALAGLLGASIVLSHGTEVYSAVVGLSVIAVCRRQHMPGTRLLRHLPLALGLAALLAAPYLPTLLGWANGGGAILSGEITASDPAGGDDWLQFALGASGAVSVLDLPVRIGLVALGLSLRRLRLAGALWLSFLALSVLVDFAGLAPIRAIFVITFPWLADHRPRQLAVVLDSLLAGGGLCLLAGVLGRRRVRLLRRPATWRRLVVASAVVLGFFVEGSAVSVYKRLAQGISEQDVYSTDDRAAMTWLRGHAQPGEVLANDESADAGIWAPYKADVPILLPRSASTSAIHTGQLILASVLDVDASPGARAAGCALHVDYLYSGARPLPDDERLVPDRSILEHTSGLEEVFSAGDAAVFRIRQPC